MYSTYIHNVCQWYASILLSSHHAAGFISYQLVMVSRTLTYVVDASIGTAQQEERTCNVVATDGSSQLLLLRG